MNEPNNHEDMIDATESTDVTEQVESHELGCNGSDDCVSADMDHLAEELPADKKYDAPVDPRDLKFNSIDGNIYLSSYDAIDWNSTSTVENIQIMEQNLALVHQLLRELIFARARGELKDDTPTVDTVYDVVKPFLEGFGHRPKYYDMYPGITYADVAFCYCIDAIEIISVVLNEAIRYRDIKEMLAVFQNAEQTNEEEET